MKYINEWSNKEIKTHVDSYVTGYEDLALNEVDIAGEGNMNFALRLKFSGDQSLIMKQSPPFCAKFPDIPAPQMRIESEQLYYKVANTNPKVFKRSPEILGFDSDARILYMSDLGEGSDYEACYEDQKLTNSELKTLCDYLSELHSIDCTNIHFENAPMRELNHQYIFDLPFKGAQGVIDLDEITPGLNDMSKKLSTMTQLKAKVSSLGEIYLKDAKCLIHGDYYPRSWLKTDKGIFIIDPEFGFEGRAEFDVAVFMAHMGMCSQYHNTFEYLKTNYLAQDGFDWDLALDFCAVEMLRRVFFVSQLPLKNDIKFKEKLFEASTNRLTKESHFEEII